MSIKTQSRPVWLVAAGFAVVVLAALAVALALRHGDEMPAEAGVPAPGLDFSIGVDIDGDGEDDCDTSGGSTESMPEATPTSGGPAECLLGPGEEFTVHVYLNALPEGVLEYAGFDILLLYEGVASQDNATTDTWPECEFPAAIYIDSAGNPVVRFGCALGLQFLSSTYIGLIGQSDFTCASPGTITMVHGVGDGEDIPTNTNLAESFSRLHAEGEGLEETLIINCPTPPPTRTPGGPTETPTSTPTPSLTPTATPVPTETQTATPTVTPTPTITPTPTRSTPLRGDVNGDRLINSQDALWVLWFHTGVILVLQFPEAADLNRDGVVGPRDALFILWIEARMVAPPR